MLPEASRPEDTKKTCWRTDELCEAGEMSAKEQMSKLLDQLMGQNRDGKEWGIG